MTALKPPCPRCHGDGYAECQCLLECEFCGQDRRTSLSEGKACCAKAAQQWGQRIEAARHWQVGDRAVWQGTYEDPGPRDVTVAAVGPDWVGVTWPGGKALTPLDWLTCPQVAKRKVVVREYDFEGRRCWGTDNPWMHCWKPTGRTHEFEVDDDKVAPSGTCRGTEGCCCVSCNNSRVTNPARI